MMPALQTAILSGLMILVSGVTIIYIRRWYLYWRQVFLIAAMEKQRSGGGQQSHEQEGEVGRTGAMNLFALVSMCYGLILLMHQSAMDAASMIISLVYSLILKLFVPAS